MLKTITKYVIKKITILNVPVYAKSSPNNIATARLKDIVNIMFSINESFL